MTSRKAALAAFCLVAACGGQVPDSNPYAGSGVGFGGYDNYAAQKAQRDAALAARRAGPVPEEQVIASETLGVLNATRPRTETTVASTQPQPAQPAGAPLPVTNTVAASQPAPAESPVLAANNPGISDEQDFSAVSSRETIESDAERLARQREAYEVVQPQAVPERPGSGGPNIVAFALSTTNNVGQQVYRRSGTVSDSKYQRACAKYASSDKAQEAFLQAGGPKRDRKGLDPDGDGFACYWDPRPFRAARQG